MQLNLRTCEYEQRFVIILRGRRKGMLHTMRSMCWRFGSSLSMKYSRAAIKADWIRNCFVRGMIKPLQLLRVRKVIYYNLVVGCIKHCVTFRKQTTTKQWLYRKLEWSVLSVFVLVFQFRKRIDALNLFVMVKLFSPYFRTRKR